jgi:SAM-dependent methyltransferase
LLVELGVRRVLDVGSGPGKFCLAAGAQAPEVAFVGVEHRPHFVAVARGAATRLASTNVEFRVGDATLAALEKFDALYLFNPFAENVFAEDEQLDHAVELSRDRYRDDLRRIRYALSLAAPGTTVITYHGFGAPLPPGYDCVRTEPIWSDALRVWRKRQRRSAKPEPRGQEPATVRLSLARARPRAVGVPKPSV